MELLDIIKDFGKQNQTALSPDDFKISSLRKKLENGVQKIVDFKIDKDNSNYILFNEINTKQFALHIYLTKIVSTINKIRQFLVEKDIKNIAENKTDDEMLILNRELDILRKMYRRRINDIISMFFDMLTEIVWRNDDNYGFIQALDSLCDDVKNKDFSKIILGLEGNTKMQICAKQYKVLFSGVDDVISEDYGDARKSLENLKNITQGDVVPNSIIAFFNEK